jgi:hypothetical protein
VYVGPRAGRRPGHEELYRNDAEKHADQEAKQREEDLGLSSHGRPEMSGAAESGGIMTAGLGRGQIVCGRDAVPQAA